MAFWRRKGERPPLPTGEPVEFEPEPKPKGVRGLLDRLTGQPESIDSEFGPLKVGDKRDAESRRKVVQQAEAVWRERYMRPFMGWFQAQVPSTDYAGPGGLRFAADTVWNLSRLYTELYTWHVLGLGEPDKASLRETIHLDRRHYEIISRFFQERYPRVAQNWVIQQFPDEGTFWAALQQAARQFERGRDDGVAQNVSAEEQAWVSGLTGMMCLAVSWAGVPPGHAA